MNCLKSIATKARRSRSTPKEKTAFVFFVSSWQIVATLVVAMMLAGPVRAQLGPPKAEVAAIVDTTTAKPGTDVHAALQVHLPEGYHTNSNQPRDPNLIPISVTFDPPPPGITFIEVVFPPATDLAQRGADQPLRVFSGDFNIGVALKVAGSAAPGTVKLPATLRYQACDEVACYAPARISVTWDLNVANAAGQKQHADVFGPIKFGSGEPAKIAEAKPIVPVLPAPTGRTAEKAIATDEVAALDRFTLKGTTTGYLDSGDFLQFIHNAENGIKEKGMFEDRGPLAILLLVLIGGLALNLTPCVLPMIPINLAIIGAGVQAGSRSRGFLLGGAYGAAMAFVYGLLGLAVILTASTFGTINSSPWFNLAIAVLFVILALAMFDMVNIDFSRFLDRFKVGDKNRGSFVIAFGMGAVAALLAGACVAPVVIQVVVFSSNLYSTGTTAALALPFLLGVGMAIPWPVAGAGIAALPKPGAWMVRIKQVFGVVILATALYYGYEAYSLFANRWVDPTEVSATVEAQLKKGWQASLADGLATAQRENKPVLIDMWATWCKNCLVMDKTTLEDPAVASALAGYVKVKFQAENPDDPKVARVMQKLDSKGLPTYVILQPKS
jgi:cytochrome c biogenesis protein CcdA/thiol-disulfide isomerase/thioredoxin